MQVQVEYRTNHLGVKMPVRFRFDGREVEIVEIVDQWYGPDYCYFKIKGNDGNLYILRLDEGRMGADDVPKPGRRISILSEPRSMHRPRLGFSLLKVPEYFPHLILIFILIFKDKPPIRPG